MAGSVASIQYQQVTDRQTDSQTDNVYSCITLCVVLLCWREIKGWEQ